MPGLPLCRCQSARVIAHMCAEAYARDHVACTGVAFLPGVLLRGNGLSSVVALSFGVVPSVTLAVPLSGTFRRSMEEAKANGIHYLAFPAISCGIYG